MSEDISKKTPLPKPAPCLCHKEGQRQIMPTSRKGLETWFQSWKKLQSTQSLKPFGHLLPLDNISAPYHSAIVQQWYAVHPDAPVSKKPFKFKGTKKPICEPIDEAWAKRESERRARARHLPTWRLERITLYKTPED